MKKAFLSILVLFILASCSDKSNAWTKEYERQASADLDHSLQHAVRDSTKRKEMVVHVIKQLKKDLPDGLESVSAVTLRVLTNKIERDFALSKGQQQTAVPWTDINEENLRMQLAEQYVQQMPNENLRAAFCNCVITQLKAREPDSLRTPIADTTLTVLTKACTLK